MNHAVVRKINAELVELANHCVEKGIANFNLNYALQKNIRIFNSAVKTIEEAIPTELKELEAKVINKAREKYSAMTDEEKLVVTDLFMLGVDVLTEEESAKHKELMMAFNEFLLQESDVVPYLIDFEKVSNVDLDYRFTAILSNFVKD